MRLTFAGLTIVALVVLAPTASAQSSVTTVTPAGPRVSEVRAGVAPRVTRTEPATTAPSLVQSNRRQTGQLLTIIGGAMFVAGVIMDDDAGTLLAVAGLAVGIYGMIQWLQTTITSP